MADGVVADDLGVGGIGIEAAPEGDVVLVVAGEAAEEQAGAADRPRVPVLDVVRVGPLRFVEEIGIEKGCGVAECVVGGGVVAGEAEHSPRG